MKTINLYGLLLCSVALLINNGCTEDTLPTSPPTNIVPHTPEQQNSAPSASAGTNIQVLLPKDFAWLSGSYSDNTPIEKFV